MATSSWLLVGALTASVSGALLSACSGGSASASDPGMGTMPAPSSTTASSGPVRFDIPIAGASPDEESQFGDGDTLFDLSLRDADGLGPLYTRTSCGDCHGSGVRGPGSVQKMAIVMADGFTPAADQSALPWGHTVHPLITAGAKTPVLPPASTALLDVKVTTRVGPVILGRGYVEAVLDSEIERVASAQAARSDGIHGRINHVVYASEPNPDARFHQHKKGDTLIGRFGFKARIGAIDDFTADALQGDMGITSPLRPTEILDPDGLTDDLKHGVDVTIDSVNLRSMYVRLTAIPTRVDVPGGAALFDKAKCSVCHVPSLRTRDDYPIKALAGIDAPIFTDVLLHDMGTELADGISDGEATSRDWRTPPLIGMRLVKTFMHDSRATTVEQAILAHGGTGSEALVSLTLFKGLSAADQATLIAYVESL